MLHRFNSYSDLVRGSSFFMTPFFSPFESTILRVLNFFRLAQRFSLRPCKVCRVKLLTKNVDLIRVSPVLFFSFSFYLGASLRGWESWLSCNGVQSSFLLKMKNFLTLIAPARRRLWTIERGRCEYCWKLAHDSGTLWWLFEHSSVYCKSCRRQRRLTNHLTL